jgi:hypothetical protein
VAAAHEARFPWLDQAARRPARLALAGIPVLGSPDCLLSAHD